MMTMAQLRSTTGRTTLRRAIPHSRAGAAHDLAADWKRWSLPEHVIAVLLVAFVVAMELAMSTSLASGGH